MRKKPLGEIFIISYQMYVTLKFTIEYEKDSVVIMLHSLVCRHEMTTKRSKIRTIVYRKKLCAASIIPAVFSHSWQYKMPAFHSYISRAYTQCREEKKNNLREEINWIIAVIKYHGYCETDIYNL